MKTLFLSVILITSTMIMASEYGYEATPIIGYNVVEKNLNLQNQSLYGGEFQINTGTFLDAEFSVLYTNTPYIDIVHFPQNTDIFRYTINGIYIFDSNSKVTPIVKVGIGFEEVDIAVGGNRDGAFVDAGLGGKIILTDSISLKTEAVYMMKITSTRQEKNIAVLAGITYSFGKKSEEKARIVKLLNSTNQIFEATNTETYDEDTNTQFTIGETIKATNTKIYQKEKDNNETIDSIYKFINTPTYNNKYDYKDYIKVVKTHLNFRNNSFAVDERTKSKVKVFVDFLNTHKDFLIQITGHASLPGTRAYNQVLSEKRAKAVKKIIIKNGIEASRIKTIGKGEDEPIINSNSRDANRLNRRIEVAPILN